MLELRLKERLSKNGTITLFVPLVARAVFVGIAAAIGGSAFVSVEAAAVPFTAAAFFDALGLPGAAVFAVAAAAALYEERWHFDAEKKTATFRFGLLFFARRRTLPFDSIATTTTELFEKGSRPGAGEGRKSTFHRKRYARLVLLLKDSSRLVVETVRAAELSRLEGIAERIAGLVGAEFQSGSW